MVQYFSKKLNKKGFTLAELLIVVAIIAVLVAIAIPIFSVQLKKAEDQRDAANERSATSMAYTQYLLDETPATKYFVHIADNNMTVDTTEAGSTYTVTFANGVPTTTPTTTAP